MPERNDERDVLEGLPADLAAILRDPSVIVPQDAAVFELIAKWMDPDAAPAMSAAEWQQAWTVTCRRMLRAQQETEHLASIVGDVRQIVREWSQLHDAEAALRSIAQRVGYYVASEPTS